MKNDKSSKEEFFKKAKKRTPTIDTYTAFSTHTGISSSLFNILKCRFLASFNV